MGWADAYEKKRIRNEKVGSITSAIKGVPSGTMTRILCGALDHKKKTRQVRNLTRGGGAGNSFVVGVRGGKTLERTVTYVRVRCTNRKFVGASEDLPLEDGGGLLRSITSEKKKTGFGGYTGGFFSGEKRKRAQARSLIGEGLPRTKWLMKLNAVKNLISRASVKRPKKWLPGGE